MLDFRTVDEDRASAILTVDIVEPAPEKALPKASDEPVIEKKSKPRSDPVKVAESCPSLTPESKAQVRPMKPKALPPKEKTVQKFAEPPSAESSGKPATTPAKTPPVPSQAAVPVGRLEQKAGVTILANESGEDTLKHGAEARFMHGVATEEFVEENYIGEYKLHDSSRVWIEDDRAHSGHLILHAEAMGLHRKLYRFNRFIYVYGYSSDTPQPVLGSVTFFSDGYQIHQFLWQHNSTKAYYPRRN